ncbi:MAG: cobalamin-dependent protein [Anaerolineae bacterium]|nr:cobalamin-dependent protein [Anaerolineae bacterium]
MSKNIQILEEFETEYSKEILTLARKPWISPDRIMNHIQQALNTSNSLRNYEKVIVSGETDNLSIYVIGLDNLIVYTPLMNIEDNTILLETSPDLWIKYSDHLCLVEKTKEIADRLTLPDVVLINLSVKDVFPAPRFALNVASLAGYIRKYQKANVKIIDMQMGYTTRDILEYIRNFSPDIVGISISFGQTSPALSILQRIFLEQDVTQTSPLVVAGNVISAFVSEKLINTFPNLVICNGEGELSVVGLIDYVNKRVSLDQVPGISYQSEGTLMRTPAIEVDMDDLPLPAMDTVEALINNNGALTMEISRGCFHSACSFCPRTHKPRRWKGLSHQ